MQNVIDRIIETPTHKWIPQPSNSSKKSKGIIIESHVTQTTQLISTEDIVLDVSWASQYLQSIDECIVFVREEMRLISEIKSIYISIDGDSVDIWILIPDRNINLVNRIVEKEINIIDRFIHDGQTKYIFEFHVLYMCQADELAIVPSDSVKIL